MLHLIITHFPTTEVEASFQDVLPNPSDRPLPSFERGYLVTVDPSSFGEQPGLVDLFSGLLPSFLAASIKSKERQVSSLGQSCESRNALVRYPTLACSSP